MGMKAARKAFTDTLLELAKSDASIFAVATDSRGSVTLSDFARELPNQFVECGIAEQDAVGVSAGLSNAGLKPFVCGPACFLSLRAAEQIKVDVAYSAANVKIIGVSGGVSYGALGYTHHAVQDIALMRAIAGLYVILPADAKQTEAMTRALVHNPYPVYVRMGRGEVPDVYGKDAPFEIGKANELRTGNDIALIACGEMVHYALRAAELLEKNCIGATVLDMHTIQPLDEGAVRKAARTGAVVTIEEHDIHGGLGSAVAEFVCQNCPVPMKILGLPHEALYNGTSMEIFEHYGLTEQGISAAALQLLGR
jgi:transketolase